MRRLLVLLSVVLLFALCQNQLTKKDRLIRPPKTHNCIFGFKKVNNIKVCKTIEEFFKHPRNDTNCTQKNKVSKCFTLYNTTACLCLKKIVPKKPINFKSKCKPGFFNRCRVNKFTGKQMCSCKKLGPIIKPVIKDYDALVKKFVEKMVLVSAQKKMIEDQ